VRRLLSVEFHISFILTPHDAQDVLVGQRLADLRVLLPELRNLLWTCPGLVER
jgi:hypothetical protein